MQVTISIEDLPQLNNNGAFRTYSSIRAVYLSLANDISSKIKENHAAFLDIDTFADEFPEHLYRHLLPAIEACATRLGLEHQIYEFSEHDVFEHLIKSSTWLEERYSTLFDTYLERRDALEKALEYREIRKDGRSRWSGGGFGLTGALSGATKAGALNIATGLLHSAFNATANAMEKSEFESFRDSYVRSASYKNVVETMFFELVCDLHLTEITLVAQSSDIHIEVFENREKREKSITMSNNIRKLALAPADLRKALLKVIDFYPYNPNIFNLWLENLGDPDNQLQQLCKELALINLLELKRHLLSEACRNKTITTTEMLTQRYAFLGMPVDACFSELDAIIANGCQERPMTIMPQTTQLQPTLQQPTLHAAVPNLGLPVDACSTELDAIIANGGQELPVTIMPQTTQPQPTLHAAEPNGDSAQKFHDDDLSRLRAHISDYSSDKDKKFYVMPDLPDKKIVNFVKKFKYPITPDEIFVFFDDTVFGQGDSGVAITATHLNIGLPFDGVHQIALKDIHEVSIAGILNKKITVALKDRKPVTFELTQSNKGAEWIHDVLRILIRQVEA